MYKNRPENTIRWLFFLLLSILIHIAFLIPINQILGLKGQAKQSEQKQIALVLLAQEPEKQINKPSVKAPVKQIAENKKEPRKQIKKEPQKNIKKKNAVATKPKLGKTTLKTDIKKPVIPNKPKAALNPEPKPRLPMATTKKVTQPSLDVGLSQDADKVLSAYQKRLLAHIQKHLMPPKNKTGEIRLQIRIEYSQVATKAIVLNTSNPDLNDWAIKAIYRANPFPPIPKDQNEPYFFRPTLLIK